ncbi:hypothetical protein MHYP_G00148430 [Metynnis hypsauchen]
MVQAFGKASGAALNLGKSVVKYFGRWTDRKDAAGGLALSDGPLKILGVSLHAGRGCPSKLGTKPLRSIVSTWSNSDPKAETLPDHYRHLVRWSKFLPAGLRPEAFVRHKTLYKEVLDGRGHRAVVGLEEDAWSRVQPKGLDNRLQDLNWQCVHGKLPVREVLYRHGLTRHPRCPRPACAKDESLRHVFWECGYARATWGKVDGLCRALDPQFALTYEKVMRGWSHDTRSLFLSRMWLLVSVTKRELWNARTSLIQKGTILDIVGIYRKICADLRFRMEHDVIRWGYHAAKERWRDLFEL